MVIGTRLPPALKVALLVALVGTIGLGLAQQARPWHAAQRADRAALSAEIETKLEAARARLQDAKAAERPANVDAATQHIEEQAALGRLERKLERLRRRAADAAPGDEAARRAQRREVEALEELVDARRAALALPSDAIAREVDELEQRLAALQSAWFWQLPGLDALDPSLAIQEATIATPSGPTVDRCATCHLGAARGEHPLADLVGPQSPHPWESFGCVSCHGGDGRATDLASSGHRVAAAAGAELALFEGPLAWSSCRTCHLDGEPMHTTVAREQGAEVQSAKMPRALDRGAHAVEALGCAGCHELGAAAGARHAAAAMPAAISLGDLAARTTPNAARRALTSDTGRPAHPWRGVDQAAPAAAQAELEAVLTWLWAASDNAPTAVEELALAPSILRRGEIRRGARLFGDLGCRACHDLDAAPAAIDRSGPPLADLSMRRNARWLSAWLRAPERVHPGTTMPNFRLDDATTADLVAFLLDGEARLNPVPAADAPSPRGDEPDRIELGRTEPEPPAQLGASALTAARDDLLLRALEAEATLEAAAARFEALDGPERWRALGRLVVERRGCAGCHRLPTDDEPPIQPLDGGSLARFGETMPMPNGGLAAELDARHAEWIGGWNLDGSLSAALEIELASWRLPQGPTPDLDPEITAGAALVARHGCDACHAFDLDAPSAAPADRFPGGRPPSLALAGRRLRAPWTAAYLDDPARETTRPWLATRMPTFDLDDEKRDALVRLFTARADQPLLVTQPTASTLERSAGAVLYSTLQCVRCHVGRLDPGGTTIEPAPLYDRAPERLRPRFVLEWILDPHDVRPDTGMPRFFAAPDQTNGTHGGLDASFLATTFETPMFGVERARLRRLFATEAEYRRFVTDPHRVAAALRAHLLELPTARRTVEPAPAPLRPDQVVFPTAQSLGRPSS